MDGEAGEERKTPRGLDIDHMAEGDRDPRSLPSTLSLTLLLSLGAQRCLRQGKGWGSRCRSSLQPGQLLIISVAHMQVGLALPYFSMPHR